MPTFATGLPVARQQFGIAKETAKGTWITSSAYLELDTFSPEDKITMLPVTGLRGSMVTDYGDVQGVGTADLSLGGAVFADTIGWPLAGLLGDLAVTGTGPYVNKMAVLNSGLGQPTSHSLTHLYQATHARGYAGTQWSEVELQYTAPDLAKFTAKATSLLSATETAPTPSYTAILPFAAWQCACLIGGASTIVVTEATVTMTRKLDIINDLNGTQAPAQIFVGPLSVMWKISGLADASDTALLEYLNNTQPAIDLTMTQSTSAILEVHSSVVAMESGPFKADKDVLEIDLAGRAIANTTDVGASSGYSPVLVTLTNSVNGGYV
ncbi:MAG: phage tail tube protein [Candidatus Dormiibacterota bacterium]